MNHPLRVGGSVFESLFQNEFPHLTSLTCQTCRPRRKAESKKRKKKILASVRRCLFPWRCGACAYVYDDLTHAYSLRQPPLLPGCRQCVCLHTAHGAVTCQALVYRTTLCSKREKSSCSSGLPEIHGYWSFWHSFAFLLSLNMVPRPGCGISFNFQSFSPKKKPSFTTWLCATAPQCVA